jgi:hypothetical protein
MSIIDIVRKWKEKNGAKSEKFKEMEEDYRLNKMLEDRQKSSTQRALEVHYKKLQEDDMKAQLKKIQHQQTKHSWKDKTLYGGKGTILKSDKSMMSGGKSILKQKNIFLNNSAGGFY